MLKRECGVVRVQLWGGSGLYLIVILSVTSYFSSEILQVQAAKSIEKGLAGITVNNSTPR